MSDSINKTKNATSRQMTVIDYNSFFVDLSHTRVYYSCEINM